MSLLDTTIVVLVLVGLVLVAAWLARRQASADDYYLGGRRLPAWSLGLSLAANQVSAISLIGAPAFVALRSGGGLVWLQYELAVPLAMAILVVWGVPLLRRASGADVYSAVEGRLGRGPRRFLAMLFLLGRGLGAGVILYTSALVVEACTGWSLPVSLLVVAGVAVAYTGLGGLIADVLSDVLQLSLLWGGTLVVSIYLALELRAQGTLLAGLDPSRLAALDFSGHGLGDGATFSFWPMLIGGLFLYVSYYGCDQTQAQRVLAAEDQAGARQALTIAALVRFPLVLTYCGLGVLLGSLLASDPGFAQALAGRPADALVPQFIVGYLPVGLLGLAVAGILAAALSSIDSALNSLSAVTLEEIFPRGGAGDSRLTLVWARFGTLAWGAWATAAAWWFSRAGETVIELVNRIGSLVYGPMLAVFVLAWRSGRATGRSAVAGGFVGLTTNFLLWQLAPDVSWLWWNVVGCLATLVFGHLGGESTRGLSAPRVGRNRESIRLALLLIAEFFVILVLLVGLTLGFGQN